MGLPPVHMRPVAYTGEDGTRWVAAYPDQETITHSLPAADVRQQRGVRGSQQVTATSQKANP